jgi:hypothetical protein
MSDKTPVRLLCIGAEMSLVEASATVRRSSILVVIVARVCAPAHIS